MAVEIDFSVLDQHIAETLETCGADIAESSRTQKPEQACRPAAENPVVAKAAEFLASLDKFDLGQTA
jgi:hypothetical protein